MATFRGFTLIELIVSLVVLSVSLGVVGIAAAPLFGRDGPPSLVERAARVQRTALRTGKPVALAVGQDLVTFWPDGTANRSTITHSGETWVIDMWTGEITRVND